MSDEYTTINIAKMPGVRDIYPVKARGKFARALMLEHQAGETTPEAWALLEEAVQIIQDEQAQLLAGV